VRGLRCRYGPSDFGTVHKCARKASPGRAGETTDSWTGRRNAKFWADEAPTRSLVYVYLPVSSRPTTIRRPSTRRRVYMSKVWSVLDAATGKKGLALSAGGSPWIGGLRHAGLRRNLIDITSAGRPSSGRASNKTGLRLLFPSGERRDGVEIKEQTVAGLPCGRARRRRSAVPHQRRRSLFRGFAMTI